MVTSPFIKGRTGELELEATQWLYLDSKVYKHFDNLIISDERGSTQIDHIIVSKHGIFVIETKNMSGWIFGSEKDKNWTQTLHGKINHFQNPLKQNYRHKKILARYLSIADKRIISVVIFWGDCEFKTPMPENVINGDIKGYTNYILGFTNTVFTDEEVSTICRKIENCKDEMVSLSGFQHIKSLNERYNSDAACPKCGSKLVERVGNSGTFLGCDSFPWCSYTK